MEDPHKDAITSSLVEFSKLAYESLMRIRENETRRIRPSFGTVCPRISYYLQQGRQPERFPAALSATFTMGHLAHQMCYGAIWSAMPKGIEAHFEVETSIDFPKTEFHNSTGTADGILSLVDGDEWKEWLPEGTPKHILLDFKTMVGFSFREHSKKSFDKFGADAWGHIRQLAIYANAPDLNERFPGLKDNGALLVAINKESPVQGIKSRLVPPEVIQEAWEDVQKNIQMHSEDPGPALLDKHKSAVAYYCGASGRKGYCPYVKECMADR